MALPTIVVPVTTACKDAPPIEVYRGDTILHPFQVVDANTKSPINVTGWTFWFTAKSSVVVPDVQAQFAQDNIVGGNGGVTIVSAQQGQGIATVLPITTRGFPDGPCCMDYDIQSMDANGVVRTIERGKYVVFPDVTRAISAP